MKKTIYLVIISVITIICIIAGSVIHLGNVDFTGGFPWGFPWGMFSDSDDESEEEISEVVPVDDFDEVRLDLNIMDVKVVVGDKAGIEYKCNRKKLVPDISVDDKVLVVKQADTKGFNNIKNVKCEMVLTVPNGKDLSTFELFSDVGDIIISDITAKDFSADMDTGDIVIKNSSFTNTNIDGDVGDIEIITSTLGETGIDNDTGNITLTDCDFPKDKGNIVITDNTGDVVINGNINDLGFYETDLSTDIGNVEVNGEKKKKHYYGDAVLSGSIKGNPRIVISTDIGDVKVNCK